MIIICKTPGQEKSQLGSILDLYRMAEVRNILQYKETVCNAYISKSPCRKVSGSISDYSST